MNSKKWKDYTSKIKQNSPEKQTSLYNIYEKINSSKSDSIEKLGGYLERAFAYDAVWAMALALDKTLKK